MSGNSKDTITDLSHDSTQKQSNDSKNGESKPQKPDPVQTKADGMNTEEVRQEAPSRRIRRNREEISLGIGVVEVPGRRPWIDPEKVLEYRTQQAGIHPTFAKPEIFIQERVAKEDLPFVPEKKEEEEGVSYLDTYNPRAFDPTKDSILNLSGLTSPHSLARDFPIVKAIIALVLRLDGEKEKQLAAELASPIIHFLLGNGPPSLIKDSIFFVGFIVFKKVGWLEDLESYLMDTIKEVVEDAIKDPTGLNSLMQAMATSLKNSKEEKKEDEGSPNS